MNTPQTIYHTPFARRVTQPFMSNSTKQLRISIGENVLIAKLNDCQASRDLTALLPMTLPLTDLFGVQKYARLPITLTETGQQMQNFEAGDIAYWSPGPGLVIFYRQHTVAPDSGLSLLGKIESGAKLLSVPQLKQVSIEIIG